MTVNNAKKLFIYFYLTLVGISLFLMAFAITFTGLKFMNSNELPPISLSSTQDIRRTITEYIPRPFVVYSGSMEPAIKTASLIFTLPSGIFDIGDVITFDKSGNGKTVTHRIQNITYSEELGANEFTTKGDANEEADQGSITQDKIVGKVFLTLPYVGHAVDFAKTPQGFILLVIVPATIIIYEELKNLLSFSKGLFKKRKTENERALISEKRSVKLPKISIAIPFVGVFLVFLGLSVSFFYDKEDSVDNILAVGEFEAPPSPTPDPSITPSPAPTDQDKLIMNEFLWNSSCTPNPETKFWVELYNAGTNVVNIKDWQFRDGNDQVLQISNAEFNLAVGEYVLIVKSNSTFSCYENQGNVRVLNLGANPDFTPENTNGIIRLEKPVGDLFEVVDRIDYGPGFLETQQDESIGRYPDATDTAFGDTFNVSDFSIYGTTSSGLANPAP